MLKILRDQALVTAGIAQRSTHAVKEAIVSEGMVKCIWIGKEFGHPFGFLGKAARQ